MAMKIVAFLVCFGLAIATAAPGATLLRRQSAQTGLASFFNSLNALSISRGDSFAEKPAKITPIEGERQTRPGSKNERYWLGPYEVPAGKGGMDQEESHSHEEPNSLKSGLPKELQTILSMMTFFTKKMDPNAFLITRLISGFCKNCTILRSKILLVDEKGEPLGVDKGIYQHHVNMLPTSMGRGEPSFAAVCPDTDTRFYPVGGYSRPVGMDVISHVFASQAVENFTLWFTTPDGKLNSGYHSDGVPVIMGAEIVNYSPIPRKVYIVVDMEYLEGKQGQRAVNMPLAVTGCLTGDFGYFSDKPVTTKPSGKFPVFNDGVIFGMRGHLHDGGDSVNLYVNGKKECVSKAGYGGPGAIRVGNDGRKWETISSMTECLTPIRVKKGDQVEVEAHYDINAHPLRLSKGQKMEQMGLMWFTFVPLPNATGKA